MGIQLKELAALVQGEVINLDALDQSDAMEQSVEGIGTLGTATANEAAFFFDPKYQNELPALRAGILVTAPPFVEPLKAARLPWWGKTPVISCPDPYVGLALLSEKLADEVSPMARVESPSVSAVHPSAVISDQAEIGANVEIGAGVVVEVGAQIGAGSILYPQVYIGPGVTLGEDCRLFPRVTLYERSRVGNRVRIHAGAVIGADGFGYAQVRKSDGAIERHQKIFHFGGVVIGDDVEIGANTCIDRGTMGDTVVEDGAKVDDLVMVGHNCRIGKKAVVCGTTGMSGRAVIDDEAFVLGKVGLINAVTVGKGAFVGAMSLVTKNIPPGERWAGNPSRPEKEFHKAHAIVNRLMKKKSARGGK